VAPTRQREEERETLLLQYWAGPSGGSRGEDSAHAAAQARRKTGRPERAVGHQAKGMLFLLVFFYFTFFCFFSFLIFQTHFQIKFS
jgi:hypothetical protein